MGSREPRGSQPDIDVDLDPAAVRKGHDPQLEKAVEEVLRLLAEHPLPEYKRPSYPDYHSKDGLGLAPPVKATGSRPGGR